MKMTAARLNFWFISCLKVHHFDSSDQLQLNSTWILRFWRRNDHVLYSVPSRTAHVIFQRTSIEIELTQIWRNRIESIWISSRIWLNWNSIDNPRLSITDVISTHRSGFQGFSYHPIQVRPESIHPFVCYKLMCWTLELNWWTWSYRA